MKWLSSWSTTVGILACAAALSGAETRVGAKVDDFTLHDYLGTKHALSDWQNKKAVVIAFLGVECPVARQYGGRL